MELTMTNVDELGFSWVHLGLGKFKKSMNFCLGGQREKRFFWKLLKYYHKHALRELPPLLCIAAAIATPTAPAISFPPPPLFLIVTI